MALVYPERVICSDVRRGGLGLVVEPPFDDWISIGNITYVARECYLSSAARVRGNMANLGG
jgi:hypothetical protein